LAKVEIRRLGPGDASVLDRVAADVFDEPINKKRLAAYLREPGHFLFVALVEELVIAQAAAVIHRHPDKVTELYIDEIGVTPAFQNQGVATRLLDALFKLGREEGCEEAWVGTGHENAAANRLYEKRGAKSEPFLLYLYKLQA
jgi:ribosomal protein S18 acetylase RimI-like enzyme